MLLINLVSMALPSDSPVNLLPDIYRAEVTVRLNSSVESSGLSSMLPSSVSSMLGSLGQPSNPNLALVQQIAKSNKILDTITEKYDFRKGYTTAPVTMARRALLRTINLSVPEDAASSGMIFVTISFGGTNKELATDVLHTLIDLIQSEFKRITLEPVTLKREFLEDRARVATADFEKAKAALASFQKRYGLDLRTAAVNEAQAIAQLQQDIYTQELKIKASYLGEDEPLVKQMRDQIRQKQKLIAEIKSGASAGGFSASPVVPLDAVPGLMSEYANLELEVRGQTEIYTMIRKELEKTKIEQASNASVFQIINPLEVPELKVLPFRGTIMIVTAITSLLSSFLLSFCFEFLKARYNDPAENKKIQALRDLLPFKRKSK
jgi:hypothetical protein